MDKATWTALTSHVITFAEVLLIYMKLQIDIAITYVYSFLQNQAKIYIKVRLNKIKSLEI